MILKDSIRSFLTQICIFVCNFIVAIITARFFGPEGKGAYFLVLLASVFLVSIFKANLDPTTVYLVGTKKFRANDIYKTLLTLGAIMGLISILAFWLFYSLGGSRLFLNIDPIIVFIGALSAPFNILNLYLTSIFWSKNQVKKVNLIQALQPFLNIIGLIIIVIAEPTIKLAVIVYSLSFVLTFIFAFFLAYKQILGIEKGYFSKRIVQELYGYGLKLHLGDLIDVIANRIDSFMVSFYAGAAAVGYYSVGVNSEIIWLLPTAIGFAIFPSVASASKKDSSEMVAKVCRIVFSISALCVIALALLSRIIISIVYGSSFLPAVLPFIILLPGVLALCLSKVLKNYLIGQNHPWLPTIGSGVTILIDLILLYVLVPRYGIVGAAASTSFAYITYATVITGAFIHVTKSSLLDILFIKKSDLSFFFNKTSNFLNKRTNEAITN